MFQPEPRATLLYPSGPSHDLRRKHLFVLITGPCGPARQVLMVPVSTRTTHSDVTCILAAGDHESIVHESVVEYRHARVEQAGMLTRGVDRGEFVPRAPVAEQLFAAICEGFHRSRFVKPFAREFLVDNAR